MIGAEVLPTVAKVVATALAKVVDARVKSHWNERRITAEVERSNYKNAASGADLINELNPAQGARLRVLLRSPEFGLAVQRTACAMFLSDGKIDEEHNKIENQVLELVRLQLPESDLTTWSHVGNYLNEAIRVQVTAYIAEHKLGSQMSNKAAAKAIPAAALHVSAGERNVDVTSRIKKLAAVQDFSGQMCSQVRDTDDTILLPHSQSTSRRVPLAELYVEPQIGSPGKESIPISEVLTASRTILLGDPGGGKSTAAQKILLSAASSGLTWQEGLSVPFLIVLRDFIPDFVAGRQSLIQHMEALCRSKYNLVPPDGAIEYLMLNGHASLILDGLDELQDIGMRSRVVDAVHSFCSLYPDAPVLVTSRRIGYEEVPLDGRVFRRLALESFDDSAVDKYTHNWFKFDETTPLAEKGSLAKAFLNESELVAELRVNPLMLALMCSIYSAEGYIPKNLPEVYEKCSTMLFERWDKQRSIVVRLPFSAHMRPGLYALASWLYGLPERQAGVPRHQIVNFVATFLHGRRFEDLGDAEDAAEKFMDFCTGRAWVLTDVGATKTEPKYGFTHRTFMEYFAARQMTRDYPSAKALLDHLLPSLLTASDDVVARIALQILGLNVSDASEHFLVLALREIRHGKLTFEGKQNLSSFVVRSLAFVVPPPAMVRSIAGEIYDRFFNEVYNSSVDADSTPSAYGTAMYDLFCATPENLETIARELASRFSESVEDAVSARKVLPQHILKCFAYPLAFARSNTWAYATSIHAEVWTAYGVEFRRLLSKYYQKHNPTSSWEKYYLWSRSAASTSAPSRLTLEHCLFSADYPKGLRHYSLATGLLAALRGSSIRDELSVKAITKSKMRTLCSEILRSELPWRSSGTADEWEVSTSTRHVLDRREVKLETIDLLAVLCVHEVDLGRLIRAVPGDQRLADWSDAIGQLVPEAALRGRSSRDVGDSLKPYLSREVADFISAWAQNSRLLTVSRAPKASVRPLGHP